jgi:hypothetical protein
VASARTKGKDVIALAAHRDGEFDRFDRAVLADRPRRILELADQLEGQLGRVARPVEHAGGERAAGFGWFCSSQMCFLQAYEYPFEPTLRASGLRASSPARRRSISIGKSYFGR